MTDQTDSCAAMYYDMTRWVALQDRKGWTSAELERWAKITLKALELCAKNDPPPALIVQLLGRCTADFAKVRAEEGELKTVLAGKIRDDLIRELPHLAPSPNRSI